VPLRLFPFARRSQGWLAYPAVRTRDISC
jgi:hypothetical protein